MAPSGYKLVEATLGIDIGSTSTRACLWVPSKKQAIHVENTVEKFHQAFLRPCDFPSEGYPFEPDGPVYLGGDVDANRRGVSLKYGFYPLADVKDKELLNQYILVQPLMERKDDPRFCARVRQGLVELLTTVNRDVQSSCRVNGLQITRIGLSIPAQWTLEFENVYKEIVAEVFGQSGDTVFFYTETEALAHFLLQEARHEFQVRKGENYGVFLFLDFGGHNMNGCIYNLVERSQDEDPSFFRIGEPFGKGGGSEHWTYNIGKKVMLQMRRMPALRISPAQQREMLESFNRGKGSLGPSQAKTSQPFGFGCFPVSMSPEGVTDCFEEGHKDVLAKAKEKIEEVSKYKAIPQVVVSGGTAKHADVQSRLRGFCEATGVPEPIFANGQSFTYSSGKIAHGVAMAASNCLTIPEFMERGAAFGLQTRECPNRGNTNPDKVWNDIGFLLLSQDQQETFWFAPTGNDEYKIICDPFFQAHPSEHLHFDRCYDVLELGKSKAGNRSITLSLVTNNGSTSLVIKTTREWRGGSKKRRRGPNRQQDHDRVDERESPRLPMYFDGGTNCAHVDLNEFDIKELDFGITRGDPPLTSNTQIESAEPQVPAIFPRFTPFFESPSPEPCSTPAASKLKHLPQRRESPMAALCSSVPIPGNVHYPRALKIPASASRFQDATPKRIRSTLEFESPAVDLYFSAPTPNRLQSSQGARGLTEESSLNPPPPPTISPWQTPVPKRSGRAKPNYGRGKAPEFDPSTGMVRFPCGETSKCFTMHPTNQLKKK